jgi:hydrogenase maturation protease
VNRSRVLVIGLGNRLRGDDGVGAIVADAIRERNVAGIQAMAFDGDGAALLECWRGLDTVIVVDAMRSPAAPGSIQRFDAAHPLPAMGQARSTHGFGLAEAVEMARHLDLLPRTLVVYGIVSESCELGEGLSASAAAAVPRVVELVLADGRGAITSTSLDTPATPIRGREDRSGQ